MKALCIERPGSALVREMAKPKAADGEVVIRVEYCGICGTDVHIFRGEYLGDYPITPGHEFSGTVTAVGAGVRRCKVGDRVAVEPNIACDNCGPCLNNRQNFCANWQAVGVSRPGGMAEYVRVPEKGVFPIGGLDFRAGAFVEPLSCVLHGLERVGVEVADRVLILGAGPIGLLLMKVALIRGASSVTMVDRNTSRLENARIEGGPTVAIAAGIDSLPADHFDLVVDATGVTALMGQTTRWARHGGRILLFGVPANGARLETDAFAIFRKGLSLISSYTSVRNSQEALRLLESGRVDVGRLVSHVLPLADFTKGVDMLERNGQAVMKILLAPGEGRA